MSKILLSNRARNTPASPIRRLAHLAEGAKKRGVHVYHLNIGQPDIPTPVEFFDAVKNFDNKVLAYESSQGMTKLRENWSKFLKTESDIDISADDLIVCTGASEALVFVFMTTCDPGDEVIVFDPTYANYMGFSAIAGVNLIPVQTDLENNFALPDSSVIKEKITNRTRAILVCNPNNPTGTVYTKKELKRLVELCDEHNIFLVSDEAYREYVYDNEKPCSILEIAKDNSRVIVVDSLSKRFSLCGARIGFLMTKNNDVIKTTLSLAQARLACSSIEQAAAAELLETVDKNYIENTRLEYEKRRDVLIKELSNIDGVKVLKPKGAFYVVAELPVENGEDFLRFMLKDFNYQNETVFLAPASGFYINQDRAVSRVRIAYVLEPEQIIKAVKVLEVGLKEYKKTNS